MSEEEQRQDRKWERIFDVLLKVAIPVLFWCFGWTTNSIENLRKETRESDKRIAIIESSRYTATQAEADREAMRAEVRAMALNIPPQWFRDQVAELASIAKMNSRLLQEIDKRLVKIESR